LRSRSGGSICDTITYNHANRLTGAVVNQCGTGTTSSYAYNGIWSAREQDGGVDQHTLRVGRQPRPTRGAEDGTRKYAWGAQGLSHNQQLGSTGSSTVEVYHADQIGTIRELTNASTGESATYTHDEFGVPTAGDGLEWSAVPLHG
jgi:hypothetical protein